tara:strand:+ start:340 stop:462 length:123 start_codon:yes stop_codon:yes gene_type:complete
MPDKMLLFSSLTRLVFSSISPAFFLGSWNAKEEEAQIIDE